jgi:hypothetical protein
MQAIRSLGDLVDNGSDLILGPGTLRLQQFKLTLICCQPQERVAASTLLSVR